MMRPFARSAKPCKPQFDGEGVVASAPADGVTAGEEAGEGVASASIFRTRPAGVRRASIGVVSGVGGGGAGVDDSVA